MNGKKQFANKSNLLLRKDKAIYDAIEFLFKINKVSTDISYSDKDYFFLIEKNYGYIKLYLYKIIPVGIFDNSKVSQIQFCVKLKKNELIYLDNNEFEMIPRRIPENQDLLYNILYKFINLNFLEEIFNDWSN